MNILKNFWTYLTGMFHKKTTEVTTEVAAAANEAEVKVEGAAKVVDAAAEEPVVAATTEISKVEAEVKENSVKAVAAVTSPEVATSASTPTVIAVEDLNSISGGSVSGPHGSWDKTGAEGGIGGSGSPAP